MALADIQAAFTGGELSPQLYGRVDIAKFQVGAALLRNFFTDYRGGAANRPGSEYIVTCKANQGNVALLPFIVSETAAYVLEVGAGYIRFISNGVQIQTSPGVAYEVATPYDNDSVPEIKYTQSADVMTLVHPRYPPANLTRTSDTTFSYAPIVIGPTQQPPTITAMRAPHDGDYDYGYLVTSVDIDGKEESLPSNPGVIKSQGLDETKNQVIGLNWTSPDQGTRHFNVYKWGPIDQTTMVPATAWGFIGTAQAAAFSDNNISADYAKAPPIWGDPFSGGQIQMVNVTGGGSGYTTVVWPAIPYVPLTFTGDGTGAAGYGVIDPASGEITGTFLTNAGKNYTSLTVTCVGNGGSGATFDVVLSDPAPLYPSVAAYVQQRRVFGGFSAKPESLVMSQIGLYNNFNTTPTALDTDAISISLAAQEVNTIKALVPVNYGMLAFTIGGTFLINGGGAGLNQPITPTNVSVTPQVSPGANDLRPIVINYDVLFGQAKGNRIRNLSFAWQRQSYTGSDITYLAPHLFDNFTTVDWAWAEEPFKLLWLVRSDGKMLTCTYVPEQEVFAWARHDTQGLYKSVCSVPEGRVNAVYTLVNRFIPPPGGGPDVRTIVQLTQTGRPTTSFNCSVFTTIFEISEIVGEVHIGDEIFSTCVASGTTIVSQTSGDPGGNGVYQISTSNSSAAAWGSTMTGHIVGTLLTVDTIVASEHHLQVGTFILGDGVTPNTYITSLGTGTGGTGTYHLSQSSTVSTGVAMWTQYGYEIPADWNYGFNDIQVFGAGGDGGAGDAGLSRGGGGGGGGAYAATQNVSHTPGTWVAYQVGSHGHFNSASSGGGSWFGGTDVDAPESGKVSARGGGNGDDRGIGLGGLGGTTAGFGDINNAGGDGGNGENHAGGAGSLPEAGGGGGGAADYTADGVAGQVGGTAGAGLGGNGGAGDGGGSTPVGGMGGLGGTTLALATSGQDGQGGAPYLGAGGGAGGGSATTGLLDGADGGYFGGGGGGAGRDGTGPGAKGLGRDGTILLTYTSPAGPCSGWMYYIERFDSRTSECWNDSWFLDCALNAELTTFDCDLHIGFAEDSTTIATVAVCNTVTVPNILVGDVIVVGCAYLTVTAVNLDGTFTADATGDLSPYYIPDTPFPIIRTILSGEWGWRTPTNIFRGLNHLEGQVVYALADGAVVGPLTVTSGSVTLPNPAVKCVVGLTYEQQIKTLYLTTDGIQPGGTDQGKRKLITGVTLRVDNTAGLTVGTTFDPTNQTPITPPVGSPADQLYTGDMRALVFPDWDTKGEICIQQSLPLPAEVLGVIVEVTPGDTGR